MKMTYVITQAIQLESDKTELKNITLVSEQLTKAIDIVTLDDIADIRPELLMAVTRATLGEELFNELYPDNVGLEDFIGKVANGAVDLIRRMVVGIYNAFKNFFVKILEWIGLRDGGFERGVTSETKAKAKRAIKDIEVSSKSTGISNDSSAAISKAKSAIKQASSSKGRKDHPKLISANKEAGMIELEAALTKSEADIIRHNKAYFKWAKAPNLALGKLTSFNSFDVLDDTVKIEISLANGRATIIMDLIDGLNKNKTPAKFDNMVSVVKKFKDDNKSIIEDHARVAKSKLTWLGNGFTRFQPRSTGEPSVVFATSPVWSPSTLKKGQNELGFVMDLETKREFYKSVVPSFETRSRALADVSNRLISAADARSLLDSESVVTMLTTTAEARRSNGDEISSELANEVKGVVKSVLVLLQAEVVYIESLTKTYNDFIRAALSMPYKI